MADYLGTFRTIELVSYASPVVMIIYTLTPENKGAFGFLVCGQFALWGANYCLYPPIAAFLFGVCSTFLIDICGYTSIRFEVLNLTFAGIGFAGALLNSRLRYLTTDIKDEVIMKHHRATSSVGSIF
jgi:ABC-type enterobactin transport system permease subunit